MLAIFFFFSCYCDFFFQIHFDMLKMVIAAVAMSAMAFTAAADARTP